MITPLLGLSAIVPVPEGGATFALLAFALVSLILIHRRFSRTRAKLVASQNAKRAMLIIAAAMCGCAASALAGPAAPPANVPEGGQTVILLVIALLALVGWRHRGAKKI